MHAVEKGKFHHSNISISSGKPRIFVSKKKHNDMDTISNFRGIGKLELVNLGKHNVLVKDTHTLKCSKFHPFSGCITFAGDISLKCVNK